MRPHALPKLSAEPHSFVGRVKEAAAMPPAT